MSTTSVVFLCFMIVVHIANKRLNLFVLSEEQMTECPSFCNSFVKAAIAEW